MRSRRSFVLSTLIAGAVIPQLSFSQVPPSPPAPAVASGQPVYDPQQFPAQRGVVQQVTLTGRGDIDGFILRDGTEVKTPPTLSTQLALLIKPGDSVTIHGLRAAALPLVSAVSITNETSHRTVSESDATVSPPLPPPAPLGAARRPLVARAVTTDVDGRVRMALHGPQGEINGVLLESGTVLRLPPDQAEQFASLFQARHTVVARGVSLSTPVGTVMEVQAIGPTRAHLQPIGPMLPEDPRAPRVGPSADAPPPAPGALVPRAGVLAPPLPGPVSPRS